VNKTSLHRGIDFVKTETDCQPDHAYHLAQQFRELFGSLNTFAQRRLPVCDDRFDPEDFAQECLIEYERTAKRNDWSDIQEPVIWKIARQRLIDCRRRVRRRPKRQNLLLDELSVPDGSQFETDSDVVTNPNEGVLGLTAKETERLRAKYLSGETYQTIAQREGMTAEGVRTAVRRAKRKLRARQHCGEVQSPSSAGV
jgi:RNA polymerase sigma factor (sigma-70 family)